MKKKEIKALKGEELKSKLDELKKELIRERSQASSNPRNPGKMKLIKKNIARILTAINEEERKQKINE